MVDHDGDVIARAPQFEEELLVCDIDVEAAGAARLRDTRARPARARASAARGGRPRLVRHRRRLATRRRRGGAVAELLDADAEIYAALVLGTRDYVAKNGFEHVVIGSRAASTRRWSRSSRSTRSAPSA